MSGVNYGNTTATTLVTISVSDVNDNTPTFNHLNYTATIQENMQSGVPVIFTANTIMSVNDIDQVSHPSGVTATYQILQWETDVFRELWKINIFDENI